jgi:hypothetical protein
MGPGVTIDVARGRVGQALAKRPQAPGPRPRSWLRRRQPRA